MTEPEAVRGAFSRVKPLTQDVQRYVRETLRPFCDSSGYAFVDRQKTAISLAEKLDGGRIKTWSEVDDLYACTVVVPVSTHENAVLDRLDASFQTRRVRSRADAKKAPDVFRFDGVRWYGTLRSDVASVYQPGVQDLIFEVQIVTAFEYAWIVVTHDLVYKADNADWQRQRLAAQLKATVEQAEVIIGAFDTASSAILVSPWPETSIKSEIIERFRSLVADGCVPSTLVPASWRRFADNVYSLVRAYENDRRKIGESTKKLLDVVESELRGSAARELPVSGSLFQYVVAVVASGQTEGDIDSFTVVPSRELSDLYGITELPRPFKFDGTASLSEVPGD